MTGIKVDINGDVKEGFKKASVKARKKGSVKVGTKGT